MPKFLNLGCNFSKEHTKAILKIKEHAIDTNSGVIVQSVFGSPSNINPFGSTRPRVRENQFAENNYSWNDYVTNTYELTKHGIEVAITINSVFPFIRESHDTHLNVYSDKKVKELFTSFVKDVSVTATRFIVANPLLLDMLHGDWADNVNHITISTIMNVHSFDQIRFIRKRWPKVDRICPALWLNRDLRWLLEAHHLCKLELLVNEFCSIGGIECEGLFRQLCYLNQCLDLENANPMKVCIEEREKHPESWLQARFILPQWLNDYYITTGIDTFKITGRTHSAEFIEFIGKAYVDEEFNGNLLELWGQLQATIDNTPKEWKEKQTKAARKIIIPTDELDPLFHRIIGNTCKKDRCAECGFCKKLIKKFIGE